MAGVQGLDVAVRGEANQITNLPWSTVSSKYVSTRISAELLSRQSLRRTLPIQAPSRAMPPRINIPPVTRALLIALLFQSILSAAIRYRQWTGTADILIPYLTLVPQLSIIYPWTFLSTSLVEGNVFTLGIAGATLFYGGRYLERAWSSRELAKFLALVTLIPNFLTFLVLVFFFTLTRDEGWTYVQSLNYCFLVGGVALC